MQDNPIRILLIEDDEDDYVLVEDLLSEAPSLKYKLDWANSYTAGLEAVSRFEHDVCLLDFRLGGRTGLELLHEIKRNGCEVPIIFLTGRGGYEVDIKAMMAGASDYLVKGQMTSDLLERSIRYSIERCNAEKELRRHQNHLEEMVRERTFQLETANEKLRQENTERRQLISQLQDALAKVKTLSGLLPICAWCKKIRDDQGYWNHVEAYIAQHTNADFTHGICPDCAKQFKGDPPTP